MSNSALILMIFVEVLVTSLTGYFFWRVLKSPVRPDDSYEDTE